MKLKIRTLCTSAAVLAVTLLLTGCLKDPEYPVLDGPYVQAYYDGALDCQVTYLDDVGPVLYFQLISTDDEDVVTYSIASQGAKKEVFDSLCAKHSDLSFHGEDPFYNEPVKKCYAKDIRSIEVVSDTDFDQDHPAGSSLKDIIVYECYSPYRWIKNGYNGTPSFQHIRVFAKDAVEDDMKMLPAIQLCTLNFYSFPVGSSFHNLTVTVETDDGEIHEYQKAVNF